MPVSDAGQSHLVVLSEAAQALRAHFLGWQCRIRQLSVRQADGRPTSGMRPSVTLTATGDTLGQIIVLIRKKNSQEVTAHFQHLVRKTRDPAERREFRACDSRILKDEIPGG